MVLVVTDESADYPGELGAVKLPFKIFMNEREIRPSTEEVCRLIERGEVLRTSQISPADFLKVFKKEDEVLCITISGELSGTYNSARIAARMSGKRVAVIDSGTISLGLGILVKKAVEMAGEGKKLEEVIEELEEFKRRIRIYFVLKDLSYLARSGRISNVISFLGNIAGVNPVMEFYMGKARVVKIVRGYERAVEEMAGMVRGEALAGYICSKELGESMAGELGTEAVELSPVIACHLGPGVAVAFVE